MHQSGRLKTPALEYRSLPLSELLIWLPEAPPLIVLERAV